MDIKKGTKVGLVPNLVPLIRKALTVKANCGERGNDTYRCTLLYFKCL